MSREIKFRSWLKNECEMLTNFGFVTNDVVSETDERVLMQYTGLKDKNCKEIYEGDILTADSYPYQDEGEYNYHLVVEYIEYGFCGVMHCVGKGKRGISHGIAENLELAEEYEVIGNIYENPELLEETA
ncbi:YopX family protein [Lysinibacillus sp. NPDC092081]|uniref:YopX family protein n=1 Tax=Lysinibacillus sp. NPDC092081 TaxID=3364131 RepID=UPI00382413BB